MVMQPLNVKLKYSSLIHVLDLDHVFPHKLNSMNLVILSTLFIFQTYEDVTDPS